MNKAHYRLVTGLLILSSAACAQQNWQIHEWGTFTSLQDESGQTIGGINTDDEPLPSFVHRIALPIQSRSEIPQLSKGIPLCDPDVTMRLETPVIYFHPPAGLDGVSTATVIVKFRGGWLSQFYPNAIVDTPGITTNSFGRLRSDTMGALEWKNFKIGGDWPLTNTSDHVWTSPRQVKCASVKNVEGESEKFLFYRGVGHLDAPLKISRDVDTGEFLFHSQLADFPLDHPLAISSAWLVDIRPNGESAFRNLPSVSLAGDSNKILMRTPAAFAPNDYSTNNREKLEVSLKTALMSKGLYDDEARALLNTWELSYFKSPGLRVFFLVPREWTDFYLPLQISLPVQVNRVMVGRIELVTPEQRAKMREIAALSPEAVESQKDQLKKNMTGLPHSYTGEKPLAAYISVPKSYQGYLDLGRFGNALLLDEERKHPTAGLAEFIQTYLLGVFPFLTNSGN